MNCPTQNILSAYIDQELPVEQAHDVAAHIAQCPECQEWVNSAQFVGSVVRNATLPEVSAELLARWSIGPMVRSGNSIDTAVDRSVRRLAGWLTAAASIALACTMVVSMSDHAEASASFTELNAAIGVTDEESVSSVDETARWITIDLSLPAAHKDGGQLQ